MPKRFRFGLETLLHHRQVIEDERAGELARSVQARLDAEVAVRTIDERTERSLADQTALLARGGFSAPDLAAFVSFRQSLEVQREQAEQAVARAIREEERARRALVQARQDREVLSRLKEKQFKAWQVEIDTAEAHLMDELATQAFARPAPLED